MRLHIRGHRASRVLGSEIVPSAGISIMPPIPEPGEVPAVDEPVCLKAQIYVCEQARSRLSSVESRLSVSDEWLFRCFVQLVSPSKDGKHFDFKNIALTGR